MSLMMSRHHEVLPRSVDAQPAMAQVGWLGQTGTVYPLDAGPNRVQEPGGFAPLYLQVGVWKEIEDGTYAVFD